MEEWRKIERFRDYSVSTLGRVRNDETGRIMAQMRNQTGIRYVGLTRNRKQIRRCVSILVAMAFLEEPEDKTFDSPINLDGDRSNNEVTNLMWRPRWFAVKFHKQFHDGYSDYPDYIYPVEDVDTGQRFSSSWEASMTQGVLVHDVFLSTETALCVWPTRQTFRQLY